MNQGIIPIVTDVRFNNEADMVRELGGFIIHIQSAEISSDTHSSEMTVDFNDLEDYRFFNHKNSLTDLTDYAKLFF